MATIKFVKLINFDDKHTDKEWGDGCFQSVSLTAGQQFFQYFSKKMQKPQKLGEKFKEYLLHQTYKQE